MSDAAAENLGIEFDVRGVTQVQKGFSTIRREALATSKIINQAMSSSRGRGRGMLNPPMRVSDIIGNAVIAASPSNAGTVSSSVSGNRIKIDIALKDAVRSVGAGGGLSIERASGRAEKLRQLPAMIKARKFYGPNQRLQDAMDAMDAAKASGDGPAFWDAKRAYDAADRQLNPVQKPKKEPKSPKQKRPYLPNGPRQQLSRVFDAMHYAASIGNDAAFDDAKDQYDRLSKRLQPKQPQNKLLQALMTTRFNVGHASPLVGRTLAAAGVDAAAAGPAAGLLLASGAAIEAAKAIWEMAKSAADATNSFSRLSISLGSSASTSGRLQAYGLSPDQASGIAERVQSSITGSPMGTAAGLRLGVYNLPGIYGNQDYGQQALTVIQNLQKVRNPNDRLALARQLGITDILPSLNASSGQLAANARTSAVTASLMTPDMASKAEDFQLSLDRVQVAIQNIITAVSPSVLSRLTDFLNGIANIADGLATWLSQHQGLIDGLVNIGMHTRLGNVASIISMGAGTSDVDLARSLDRNTKATEANTLAIPGSYGNISRQGVAGSHMGNGFELRKALDAGALVQSTI